MTLYSAVQMTSPTTGNGLTLTLSGIVSGFQSWANAGAVNNSVVSYGITDLAFSWELGQGAYITNSSGNFLSRTTVEFSSAANAYINCTGSQIVYGTFLDYDYNTINAANSITVGNSTVNTFVNSTIEIVANSSGQTVISAASFTLGNSTANLLANSTTKQVVNSTANSVLHPGTLTLAGTGSNTGLIVGTANISGTAAFANGFDFLTNGLMVQWGVANTPNTATKITFQKAFTTNVLCVTLTANSTLLPNNIYLVNANSSAFNMISSGNSSNVAIDWIALGH